MKKLLRVSQGMGISDEQDISQYIPDFTEARDYAFKLLANLSRLIDGECTCGCHHDPYFSGTRRADAVNNPFDGLHSVSDKGIAPGETFGGYANQIHQTPGHTCAPFYGSGISGSLNGNGDVTIDMKENYPSFADSLFLHSDYNNRIRDMVTSQLNTIVILYIVNAILVKEYYCNKPVQKLNLSEAFAKVFTTVVKYVSNSSDERVVGISCVDGQFGDSPNMLYQNAILVHLSSDNVDSYLRGFIRQLEDLGLVVRYGTQAEVQKVIENKNTTLNWSFGISSSKTTIDFVFAGCRVSEANQYKVTVHSSPNIAVDAPINVGMLVNKGGRIEFNVGMDKEFLPWSIVVQTKDSSDVIIPFTATGEVLMHQNGIEFEVMPSHTADICGRRLYRFRMNNVQTDTKLIFSDCKVTKDLDIVTPNVSTVAYPGEFKENALIPFRMTLQFNDDVELLARFLQVYAIPVDAYNMEELPAVYRVVSTVTSNPTGFGQKPKYVIEGLVNSNLFNELNAVLFRVVIPEGGLARNTTSGVLRSAESFIQLESQFGTQLTLSRSVGYTGSMANDKVIPSTVMTVKIAKEQNDYFALTTFVPNGYNLTNIDGADVPVGLTNKITYNVNKFYGKEDGEKYYFAQLLIPLSGMLYETDGVVSTVTVDLDVISRINAEFYCICEATENSIMLEEGEYRNRFKVSYKGISRPYVNGYIEVPVVFAANDKIAITIKSGTGIGKTVLVTVDLDVPETVNPFSPGMNIINATGEFVNYVPGDGALTSDAFLYYTTGIADVVKTTTLEELLVIVGDEGVSTDGHWWLDIANKDEIKAYYATGEGAFQFGVSADWRISNSGKFMTATEFADLPAYDSLVETTFDNEQDSSIGVFITSVDLTGSDEPGSDNPKPGEDSGDTTPDDGKDDQTSGSEGETPSTGEGEKEPTEGDGSETIPTE